MLVLKDANYMDWKSLEFRSGHILVSEDESKPFEFIKEFNSADPILDIIDCKGKYVTKSFGCAHHQAYSALTTGMPALAKPTSNFYESLKNIWWKFDKALDLETIKICAYATAIACAKNGVTFIIDHHSSPIAVDGALQAISEAFAEVGVGHLLSYEISDRDGVDIARKSLVETENYLQSNQGLVGLHSSFTLTNKTLEKAVKLAYKYNSGILVKVAEDIYDQEHCYDIHNKRVIERFYDFGVLNLPKSLLVHCLYLTDQERNMIRQSGVHVVQNTESNLNNNEGHFSSCGIGKNIMLGTGGIHSNMLRAAKATYFNGQLNDTLDCREIYSRFRNIHEYLNMNNFSGDKENNLVVLDYQPHTHFSKENFLGHFLYGFDASNIQHVISQGKLIVNNRQLTTIDEKEIKEKAKELSKKLWSRMHEFVLS